MSFYYLLLSGLNLRLSKKGIEWATLLLSAGYIKEWTIRTDMGLDKLKLISLRWIPFMCLGIQSSSFRCLKNILPKK